MILDELITILGFDVKDMDKLDKYKRGISNAVNELKSMATVATATFGAMVAGVTAVNAETAKMANLADAVGMDYEIANTFSGIAKSIGLDGEHVVDMFEEMNNKIGESKALYQDWLKNGKNNGKEFKAVGGLEDFLKGVDLSVVDESFKNLKLPEIMAKLSTMDSSTQFILFQGAAAMAKDAQQAASSLDILMGGESNKILMAYRKELERLGMTAKEFVQYKNSLNFLDETSIKSAQEYTRAISDTKSMFGSIGQQISAVGGKYLTPIIEKMNKWLIANKEIIKLKIDKYIAMATNVMKHFWNIIKHVYTTVNTVADALGGWDVVLVILWAIMMYFNPWKALILGVLLVVDDLIAYFKGGKSVIGNFINYFKTEFPLLSSIIESMGEVWSSVFGLFRAIYNEWIKPIFDMFSSDSKASSNSILSNFEGSFDSIGVVVKSFYEVISSIFKILTDMIKGDWDGVGKHLGELFEWMITGFDGVVGFFTNGAKSFRSIWSSAIDWIMSKIEWVTNKIDSVKKIAGNVVDNVANVGGAVADGAKGAWGSVVNFFGGEEKVSKSKEVVHNVKESVTSNSLLHKSINYAPTPAPAPINNYKTIAPVHHHNSTYNMNVVGGTTPREVAYAVQEQIIDSKAIEMANVNRVVPSYRDM